MTVFYLDTSLASSTYYYLYLLFVLYLIIILLILLLSADIYNIYEALNQDFIVSTIYKYIWKDRDNNNDIYMSTIYIKNKEPIDRIYAECCVWLWAFMYIYDYGSITNIANPNTPFHLYHWLSVGSVMTIRTLAGCKCRHTLRANILGRACFFPYGA